MNARMNVDLATTFTFMRVEYFLEVDRVQLTLKRNPIRPDVMYFLLAGDKPALHRYARNRHGSVALYCASVCALCAARCGGLRSTRSGQKKVQGWRKGAGSKIAVGPPIPIYIYIYISRVTESQANTSVWGSLKLAPIINKAHVYDLPKRPSQTTTSAGKSFHGTVRRTRDPRKHIIDARSRAKLRRVRIHAMITLKGVLRRSPNKSASRR